MGEMTEWQRQDDRGEPQDDEMEYMAKLAIVQRIDRGLADHDDAIYIAKLLGVAKEIQP